MKQDEGHKKMLCSDPSRVLGEERYDTEEVQINSTVLILYVQIIKECNIT